MTNFALAMVNLELSKYKCALFDLDGVIFDTEPQYSIFWGQMARKYRPDIPGLENKIKGQSLKEIFEKYFSDIRSEWAEITDKLNSWEASMQYVYIPGFEEFIELLYKRGIKTAVVTSSNHDKMNSVYVQHPELKTLFDEILTAEDFARSKPDPDCYQKGMARFHCTPEESIVLEDSINGLKAGRASGAFVIGLATTNPQEVISKYSDIVIPNYL